MSYDIYIGEAQIEVDKEDGRINLDVARLERDDAPVFLNDEMTGNGNHRHPGYSGWHEWTRKVGLEEMFFDKEVGLMRDHPGIKLLTPEILEKIQTTLKDWRNKYPEANPRFGGWTHEESAIEVKDEDAAIARLIWLEYWVRYAIENCKIPAIENH